MAKLNEYFEVRYVKTYTREEEKNRDSGYETTVNNVFDEGTKTFETFDEIKDWINDLKEFQDKDEDKDAYSYVDYSYMDYADRHPEICGIVVNNRKESVKYEEIEEEIYLYAEYIINTNDIEIRNEIDKVLNNFNVDDMIFEFEEYAKYINDYENFEQFVKDNNENINWIYSKYEEGEYKIIVKGENTVFNEIELGIMEIETIWININKIHSEDISEEDLKNIIE